MHKLKFSMLKGEHWYGGHTNLGFFMPLSRKSVFRVDLTHISSYGQANTLFVSNKGRIVYSEKGFITSFFFGLVSCSGKDKIHLLQADDHTLRGAYLLAVDKFMKPDGAYPNELMFKVPQYCTWIQLDNNQNQQGILDYAQSILDCGMPAGELIIDDGWQTTFGDWTFDKNKFQSPKEMIVKLKQMGFKIILWICPFVSESSQHYAFLKDNDLLVKTKDNAIAFRKWWNGVDAVLDFSNPKAVDWFFEQTDFLTTEYGVDGFKQDAGDAMYYQDDDITFGNVDANTQSQLWALSAKKYEFNELRACFKCGCMGVAQRLADKSHKWGILGLGALIPNALIQGISGYAYTCPDMIGGGQIGDFRGVPQESLDHELFARYCQTSALMPMMQYSLDIWNLGNDTTRKICQDMTALHMQFSDYIMNYVKQSSQTGEPIVRYMEYNYPNRKYAKVKTQFMLGDKYIVAPVLKKGETTKKVHIPNGKWSYKGKIYSDCVVKIPCAIDELICLEKVD